jgi:hypothetical protein
MEKKSFEFHLVELSSGTFCFMAYPEKRRIFYNYIHAFSARSYQISSDNKFHSYVMMFAEREIACSQAFSPL